MKMSSSVFVTIEFLPEPIVKISIHAGVFHANEAVNAYLKDPTILVLAEKIPTVLTVNITKIYQQVQQYLQRTS